MRLILIFLLTAALGMGQYTSGLPLSGLPIGTNGVSTYQPTTNANWTSVNWVPQVSKTLSKFMFRVSAVAGALGVNDIQVELLSPYTLVRPTSTVTFTDATDIATVGTTGGHPLVNGDTVMFSTSGALPAGVTDTTVYYVCNKTTTTIQIDDSAGCGSIVTDFSGGSGTHAIRNMLETRATVTVTPTGAAWVEVTGFTTALTAFRQYTFLIRNMNATPASNNFTIYAVQIPIVGAASLSTTAYPWIIGWSNQTASGTGSWAGVVPHAGGYRIEYSDGTLEGVPTESIVASDTVYDVNQSGVRYSLPAGVKPRVGCIVMAAAATTNVIPAQDMVFKLYTGADGAETLAGTTQPTRIQYGQNGLSAPRIGCFSSPVALTESAVIRAMASFNGTGGTTTYSYTVPKVSIHDAAGSKALIYGGAQYARYNGSTWTYTDTAFVPFALILDPAQPFDTFAAGGGARSFGWVQ